jgi:hypothetical protein
MATFPKAPSLQDSLRTLPTWGAAPVSKDEQQTFLQNRVAPPRRPNPGMMEQYFSFADRYPIAKLPLYMLGGAITLGGASAALPWLLFDEAVGNKYVWPHVLPAADRALTFLGGDEETQSREWPMMKSWNDRNTMKVLSEQERKRRWDDEVRRKAAEMMGER